MAPVSLQLPGVATRGQVWWAPSGWEPRQVGCTCGLSVAIHSHPGVSSGGRWAEEGSVWLRPAQLLVPGEGVWPQSPCRPSLRPRAGVAVGGRQVGPGSFCSEGPGGVAVSGRSSDCPVPAGSCFWVAVLDGNVVGIVAARAHEADNTVELLRMSVDSRFRGKGIAKALGRKVLEFALVHNYSAVVLGTTAVKVAAHKLYESLGFRHMGSSDHYVLPGMTLSLAERLFFQVRYHRYRLQLREE